MFGFVRSTHVARNDHAACSGCSLCLLVCPVWRSTHDLRLTPHGRAKALQHGATIEEITPAIQACTLCGACEPVCPEKIGLTGMIEALRRESRLPGSAVVDKLQACMDVETTRPHTAPHAATNVWLPGLALRKQPALLARIGALLGNARRMATGDDDGSDIAQALEIGVAVPPQRLERFLAGLRQVKTIIVADGLLFRHLRRWLPNANIVSLGVALSGLPDLRRRLRSDDLYVIEPRTYHADYETLVKYYDRLRVEADCAFNLDLQRIAIPAGARSLPQYLGLATPAGADQVRWILQGRQIARIVLENEDDRAAFEQASALPVVHLAQVAGDEQGLS